MNSSTQIPQPQADMRLQRIFEAILDSVIITDPDGRIVDCNPATQTMFGFNREELIGKTPGELWHRPEESGRLNEHIREMVNKYGVWKGEIHFIRKDKSPGVADVVVVPLLEKTGEESAKIGVSRDITDRVNAERTLELQKQTLENLVAIARSITRRLDLNDTLQDSVEVATHLTGANYGSLFLLDQTGTATHFLLVNRKESSPESQRNIIGQVLDKGLAGWVVRNKCLALVDDTDLDSRWLNLPDQPYHVRSALVVPLLDYGEQVIGVLSLMHEEPNHFTEEHARLMEASAEQLVVALGNSQLYERSKQLNAELIAARDAAEAASRAKSNFLASVSHEVRTPLNAIIGYSELVRDILNERGIYDLDAEIGNILSASNHLLELITDILDLAKIEAGRMTIKPQLFDVHLMVEAVANGIRPLVETSGNTLEIQIDENVTLMKADPLRVKQILMNLLSNAAKFTRHGWIKMRIWKTGAADLERIHFEVSDNGIGIMPDLLPVIFEPFEQETSSRTQPRAGSGLGLAISQQFCRMMGGEINVTSTPGKGSTFTFSLPGESSEVL